MTFSYPILTEEEAQNERFTLIDDGIYDFEVASATAKMSKPKPGKESNPMIELSLRVWDKNGKERLIFDYLVGSKNMAWKTRHFCEAVGLSKEYEAGSFNETICERRCGKVSVGFRAPQPKEGGGVYPAKNVVEDYISTEESKKNKPSNNDFEDDKDIPF